MILPAKAKAYLQEHLVSVLYCCTVFDVVMFN